METEANHADADRTVRGHIAELDGLRGIAILLVLLHHFWPKEGWLKQFEHHAHLGWIGVDLFFVISGFLISGILLDTRDNPGYFRNFYARRGLRIFPLYYAFLLLAFSVIPTVQGGPYFETEFLKESGSPLWYACYLGNVREAITNREPAYILAPLWSLSIEEQFYITFPLLIWLIPARHVHVLLWAMLIGAPLFRTVMMVLFPSAERIQYLATFSRVDAIAFGAMIAASFRGQALAIPSRTAASVMLVAALGVFGAAYAVTGFDRTQVFCRTIGYSLVGATFAALVLWTVLQRDSPWTAWLRSPPMRVLGTACYGIYLLQRPTEVVLGKVLGKVHFPYDPDSLSGTLLKCSAAILVGIASWYLFEKPILRFKRLFESTNHPQAAEARESARKSHAP